MTATSYINGDPGTGDAPHPTSPQIFWKKNLSSKRVINKYNLIDKGHKYSEPIILQ
jgi:hypothetical protein